MTGKTQFKPSMYGPMAATESVVKILNNELLTGIIDKKHIAAQTNSLTHCINELIGGEAAGTFITSYGKLTTYYLQRKGFTCSLEDMVMQDKADKDRQKIYRHINERFEKAASEFVELPGEHSFEDLKRLVRHKIETDPVAAGTFDGIAQKQSGELTMAIQAVCKPEYLKTHIPRNHLAYMILAGAKGSGVNLQMMTTCLGQQSLEGKRVPTTACYRTLPCYRPFENIHPIAGGYIFDRYLTSLRPQSFFFHHQAGREGLVDTAVKTATSGYFQRCIIKSVEGISVKYDGTVRDGANSILQLCYGGDGIDQTKKSMLHNFDFIFNNLEIYKNTYMGDEHAFDVNEYFEKMKGYLD